MNEIKSNGVESIIAHAIAEMESEYGRKLSAKEINLAELYSYLPSLHVYTHNHTHTHTHIAKD